MSLLFTGDAAHPHKAMQMIETGTLKKNTNLPFA